MEGEKDTIERRYIIQKAVKGKGSIGGSGRQC